MSARRRRTESSLIPSCAKGLVDTKGSAAAVSLEFLASVVQLDPFVVIEVCDKGGTTFNRIAITTKLELGVSTLCTTKDVVPSFTVSVTKVFASGSKITWYVR